MLVARGFTRCRLSRARAGSSLQFAYFYLARSLRHARTRQSTAKLVAFLTPARATKLILNRVIRGISDIDLYI